MVDPLCREVGEFLLFFVGYLPLLSLVGVESSDDID